MRLIVVSLPFCFHVYLNCVEHFRHYIVTRLFISNRDRRGHDRMVVGFTTTYAISAHHD